MEFICEESPAKDASSSPAKAAEDQRMENGRALAVAPSPVNDTDGERNGLSDHENSEDEQAEYAPWQDVDLNPAVDMVRPLVDGGACGLGVLIHPSLSLH